MRQGRQARGGLLAGGAAATVAELHHLMCRCGSRTAMRHLPLHLHPLTDVLSAWQASAAKLAPRPQTPGAQFSLQLSIGRRELAVRA